MKGTQYSQCLSDVANCPQCEQPFGRLSIPPKCPNEEFDGVVVLPLQELEHQREKCNFKPKLVAACRSVDHICEFQTNIKTSITTSDINNRFDSMADFHRHSDTDSTSLSRVDVRQEASPHRWGLFCVDYVKCGNCNKSLVVGVRYKCLQCHDYDLCTECMEQHRRPHSHHVFAIITTAEQQRFMNRYYCIKEDKSLLKIMLDRGLSGIYGLIRGIGNACKQINCDNCAVIVAVGEVRYRCLHCRNFTMCKLCVDNVAHDQHLFAVIRNGRDHSFIKQKHMNAGRRKLYH